MSDQTRETSDAHLWVATVAIAEHAREHDLDYPTEMFAPGGYGLEQNPDTILLLVRNDSLDAWLDSVHVDRTEQRRGPEHPAHAGLSYTRWTHQARLPAHGLRVTIMALVADPSRELPRPTHLRAVPTIGAEA